MILDTSILIEILKNNISIQDKLERIGEKVATTAITEHELLKFLKEDKAKELLNTVDIYPFGGNAPEKSASIFKNLKKRGTMINEFDILIAAIAITHDELLVTKDNDFKSIEGLKLLVL